MSEDFYTILGLNRDCTSNDIASAYRKMALLWHPDRNQRPEAEGKFNKLAEAYETLSNPDKRTQYDLKLDKQKCAKVGGKPTVYHFSSSNANNIFESMFGKRGIEHILKNLSNPSKSEQRDDIKKIPYYCSLEDLYTGKNKIIKLENSRCLRTIEIPKGCKEGAIIPVKNPENDNTVNYIIYSNKHQVYRRVNDDLHMNHTLSLEEFVNGFSINMVTLDNRKKKITHKYAEKTIGPNLIMKLKSLGMTKSNSEDYGDLYIHFSIVMPKSI